VAAPAKAFTVITDGRVDADSPVNQSLVTDLRNNTEHLEEWLGKSFTAEVDHNHDGINSATIQRSEWLSLIASDHFFFLEDSSDWAKNDLINSSFAKIDKAIWFVSVPNNMTIEGHDGHDLALWRGIAGLGTLKIESRRSCAGAQRNMRFVVRAAMSAYANMTAFNFGLAAFEAINNFATFQKGTNADTLKFVSNIGGTNETTDNLTGFSWGSSAWNELRIDLWEIAADAPNGVTLRVVAADRANGHFGMGTAHYPVLSERLTPPRKP